MQPVLREFFTPRALNKPGAFNANCWISASDLCKLNSGQAHLRGGNLEKINAERGFVRVNTCFMQLLFGTLNCFIKTRLRNHKCIRREALTAPLVNGVD